MIKLETTSLGCELKGVITTTVTKRGYNSVETIYGQEKQEYTRGVINITLTVNYMSDDNYEKLFDIFLSGNEISISDVTQGGEYIDYIISGETLNLVKNVDFEKRQYYYSGSIELHKI